MNCRIRLDEFDIMKGFAMLSVIVSHIIFEPFFSLYHIPMFFFVAGYFFKPKDSIELLKNNCKQLLLPYIKVGCIILLCYLLIFGKSYANVYMQNLLLGTTINNSLHISIGPIWFLLTLFWVRTIYNIVYSNPIIVIIITAIFTGGCIAISQYFNWLNIPYMIVQSIPALFFYSFGHFAKKRNFLQYKIRKLDLLIPSSFFTIILSFFEISRGGVNISMMDIRYYPLSFINAILIIYLFWRLANFMKERRCIATRFVKFCGEKSLDLLLCHSVAFCILLPLFQTAMKSLDTTFVKAIFLGFNILFNIAICVIYAFIKQRLTIKSIH